MASPGLVRVTALLVEAERIVDAEPDQARDLVVEAMQTARDGELPFEMGRAWELLVRVAIATGHLDQAQDALEQ